MTYEAAKVGIIGDLHFSDRATGKYVDYFANCREIGEQISKMIISENLTHLVLTGDLVGTNSNTMQTNAARLYLFQLFAQWNTLLNGNLYCVKGNHDAGANTCDFDLLYGAMLFKRVPELDAGAFRIHMIDYGDDNRALKFDNEHERINVACMHTHLTVENKTNFIPFKGGTELSDMKNLKGCEVVACGHIHNPSLGYLTTSIEDAPVSLIYLGCPTRPSAADNWDKTSVLILETTIEDGMVNTFQKVATFNLRNKAELVKESITEVNLETPTAEENVTNIEELERILSDLNNFQIGGIGSYREQLNKYASVNKEAVNLALEYIEKAEEICKPKGNKTSGVQ